MRCTLLEKDDVLVARMPDPLGRACLYPGSTRPAVTVVDVCIIRTGRIGVDPRWLMWSINSPRVRQQIQNYQTGTTRKRISRKNLERIQLAVPPLAEQLRIVEALDGHLSRLDSAEVNIESCLTRIRHVWVATLNGVAKGCYRGNLLPFQTLPISELAEVVGGIQKQRKRAPVKNSFPFLRVANVARGKLNLSEIHRIELFDGELDRYRLRLGDLLVVEGNGSPEQVGRAACWNATVSDAVHQNHLIRVRPGGRLIPRYLELVWNSPLVMKQLREVARSTSGLYTLSTSKIKAIRIPVPSISDQMALIDGADTWETYTLSSHDSFKRAKIRCKSLRQAILNRALMGQLVPQDPADEPASVLLERIRAERAAQPSKFGRAIRSPGDTHATNTKPVPPPSNSGKFSTIAVQEELPF